MGKGGTRFVPEAVGHRSIRQRSAYTNKELKRNMQIYLQTGNHPEIESASKEKPHVANLRPLPLYNQNRPFIFLDIAIQKEIIGRLVIELFEDYLPVAIGGIINRCKVGSQMTLKGSKIHKLLPNFAVFLGKLIECNGIRVDKNKSLHNLEKGTLAISFTGDELVIALTKEAIGLDKDYQVVGRISEGFQILDKINDLTTKSGDVPVLDVKISDCGISDHKGNIRGCEKNNKQNIKRMRNESNTDMQKRTKSMKDALKEGLSVLKSKEKHKTEKKSKFKLLESSDSSPSPEIT